MLKGQAEAAQNTSSLRKCGAPRCIPGESAAHASSCHHVSLNGYSTTAHRSRRRAAQPPLRQLPPARLHPAAPVLAAEVAAASGAAGADARVPKRLQRRRRRWQPFSPTSMAKRASWRESRAPPRHATNEAEVECLGEKTREERDAARGGSSGAGARVKSEHSSQSRV